ncbi:hypothetical protein [Sulfitobacter sp. S190]|uniref:cupredoxin domain-containing protein n=1 Tax=Sulfitobacter sp. S190 TaxID=2867022 RepID=UPI0021A7BF27|nr:hypothetical protein [Sulfitobacter sp. S190]UWR23221.1 hypothetical protein K3756_04295 [Sulfitobacter sp. S190]
MLNSFRAGAAVLAAATTLIASSSMAREAQTHNILVFGTAYFPDITFVQPGDTLTFINEADVPHTVATGEEGWTTGEIPVAGAVSVLVEEDMQTTFSGVGEEEALLEGALDFNPPPVLDLADN